MPLSRTRTTACSPTRAALSSIRPPGFVYLAAFVSRFANTCVSRTESPSIAIGSLGMLTDSS